MPKLKKEISDLEKKVAKEAKEAADEVENKVSIVKRLSKKFTNVRFLFACLMVVTLLSLVSTGYFYFQYTNSRNGVLGEHDNVAADKNLVEQIGKLIVLPDEAPTIATVSDKDQLKSQSFFANAENGDKVLLYKNSKKAILYRPLIDKIVDVASVSFSAGPTPSVVPSETQKRQDPVTIAILNGTATPGLARKAQTSLLPLKGFDIKSLGNANKNDYPDTIVVNLNGVDAQKVQEIADKLKASVGSLPPSESNPGSDVVVILGSSFVK